MRQGLTFGLMCIFAVTATLGIWMAQRTSRSLRSAEADLSAAQRVIRQYGEEDRASFVDVQQAIEGVLQQTWLSEQPVSRSMVQQLSQSQAFLSRFTDRHADDPAATLVCARAFFLISRVAWIFGQLDEAEDALRQSKRLLDELCAAAPIAENLLGKMITDNSLGCLLFARGQAGDAEQLFQQVVELTATTAIDSPVAEMQLAILAQANRNLALVRSSGGREGLGSMLRSVELTREQSRQAADSVAVDEILIDALQTLGELQWRGGDITAAQETCHETLKVIEQLRRKVPAVSSRVGRTPPSLHHDQARKMVNDNLVWLEKLAGEPNGEVGGVWSWRELHRQPTETISTDILVKGRLPADFERHDAILVTWLDRPWSAQILTQIVAATWQRTQVVVLVENDQLEQQARAAFQRAQVDLRSLQFYHLPTDTVWARDWGPLTISTGSAGTKWVNSVSTADLNFPRFRDDHIPLGLSRIVGVPTVNVPIFLQGGAILGNGTDVCVVAKSQLSWNEQLGISEQQVTSTLRRLTGAQQLIYLDSLVDEPTEHVDWFMAFTSPDTVVVGDYGTEDPANARLLDDHAATLARVTTSGRPLQVKRIPMPPRGRHYFGGTYTNVVFANGALLVPTWPDAKQVNEEALGIYRDLLPEWDVIGIDCSALVMREGALHCATRNVFRWPE